MSADVKVNILADAGQATTEVNKFAASTEGGANKISASSDKASSSVAGVGKEIAQMSGAAGGQIGMVGNQVGGLVTQFGNLGAAQGVTLGVAAGITAIGVALYGIGAEFDAAYDHLAIFTGKGGAELTALQGQFDRVYSEVPNSSEDVAAALSLVTSRLDLQGDAAGDLSKQLLTLSRLTGGDITSNTDAAIDVFDRWGVSTKDQADTLDMFMAASERSGIGVTQLMQQVANGAAGFQEFGYSLQQATAMLAAIGKTGGDADKITAGLSKGIVGIGKMQDEAGAAAVKGSAAAVKAGEQQASQQEAIAKAIQTVIDKQLKLGAAQAEYQRTLSSGVELAVANGRNDLAKATNNINDAQLALIDSKRKLDELLKGPTEQQVAEQRQKVAEAEAAITTALIAQAQAQNDLADARSSGVSGTDLARKQDAVTQANLALSKAQTNVTGTASDLNDMLNWQISKAPEIADAQQSVANATQKVSDANQDQANTQDRLKQQLGPNLDGQAMVWAAAMKVQSAQNDVTEALQAQKDAQHKSTVASAQAAQTTDQLGGSYKKTQDELKALGLEHASSADQVQGLIKWMGTSADTIAATGVAAELFGARSAPAMVKSLQDAQAAVGGIDSAMDGSHGKIDQLAKGTDDATEKISQSWNKIKSGIAPVAKAIFDGVSSVVNYFYDAGAHWSENWNGFWENFHNGWNRIVDFVKGIPSAIGDAASGMWNGITNAFKGMILWIYSKWNAFADFMSFDLPDVLGGAHIQLIPHLTAPKFHGGGTVPGPVGADRLILAQGGETISTPTGGSGDGGGNIYHFHNHGVIGSQEEAERWILESIAAANRKGKTKLVA